MRMRSITIGLAVVALAALAATAALLPYPRESSAGPPLPILCADDDFEENDTVATASPIVPPFGQSGLFACANDFDAYSFPLATGGDVQIDALFSDADGNIDLVLFSPSGSVVAVGNSETDNEKISYRAIQDGTYTARVQLTGGDPSDRTLYRLEITKSCSDDSFEENDSPGGASAVSLPFNFAGLRACPADNDWFSFPLSAGQQIQVNAFFIHAAGGNIDVGLRDPNGVLVELSGSPTDNEKITHTAAKDGTYAVGVGMPPNARAEGNGYWLQISAAATPLACLDDAFEDNDTRETAAAVSLPFSQPGLAVCFEPQDEDWFSFPLSTGAAVQIDAIFSHDDGNINIRLFRDGTPVAQSISLDDNEKIAFTATADGTYTVQVDPLPDPFSDPGNTYALEISATCVSDAFEPNDSLETAAPVSLPFSEAALTVCPEEQDYFSLQLTAGGTVQIDASFSTAEGNIDIRLFDPEGGVVAQSTSETDAEKISYTAATTGSHTLQVELLPDPLTAPGNSYRLVISATEPPPTATPTDTPTPTATPPTTEPTVVATATATTTATSPVVPATSTPTDTPPLFSPTSTPTDTPAIACGDANNDGSVNSIDSALILQSIAGLIPSVPNPERADVNGDGQVNSLDSLLILQNVGGLLPMLAC